MTPALRPGQHPSARWFSEADCRLEDLQALVEQETNLQNYPRAHCVEQNVLLYKGDQLRMLATRGTDRQSLQAELAGALMEGPGIVVFKAAFADSSLVDRASAVFQAILDEESASGVGRGDHFAKSGANGRVWNALEKMALREPEAFADYYANDLIALASEAWLGPGYQLTSQVNLVYPGGDAQAPHRDYHLGFLTNEQAAAFPAHVHRLSPVLTLQGAVAHCDMRLESGPTTYLPHSQKFQAGYLAWRLSEFRSYFDERHSQLALDKGDAVFFNPALFHAAGRNRTTDIGRMANLLQVSSALGRAMETIDREAMAKALYPVLLRRKGEGASETWLQNVVAASAEGYPFPTNLDRDPPVDGLAPPSQADLVRRALREEWTPEALGRELSAAAVRRRSR